MDKIEYKAGQKIRILDTMALRGWRYGEQLIGKEFILDKDDAEQLNKPKAYAHFEKNKYQINFYHGMFELIEEQWDK